MKLRRKRRTTILPRGVSRVALRKVPTDTIIETVCYYMGIHKEDLSIETRLQKIVESRQLILYFMSLKPISWRAVGESIGMDHATAYYSRTLIENRMATYRSYYHRVYDLSRIIEKTTAL